MNRGKSEKLDRLRSEEKRYPILPEFGTYEKYSFQMFDHFMTTFEILKKRESSNQMKMQDASTKLLALSRHLLSFAPGIRPPKKTPSRAVTEEGVND